MLKSAQTVCGLTAGTAGGVRSEISGSGVKKKRRRKKNKKRRAVHSRAALCMSPSPGERT